MTIENSDVSINETLPVFQKESKFDNLASKRGSEVQQNLHKSVLLSGPVADHSILIPGNPIVICQG
ncbi:MAG: hypothetical protein A2427_03185 [Candidatus Nealsonbacteria bacterium RIFOXYC1_FULL_40_7]|uniref:Uncharacterized protein n=1 Tax=Candidatus Nealsonbacteria bacterium RIFOXYC1_FULL_40_7 TaxID=1801678 RepID=A0A1G2ENF9_9BACT|nr:MAG: hypothetical protein A2427_03185 [Candidatus Nealsonbacteria bacterium RIFOXYC1_FULL_40_7]